MEAVSSLYRGSIYSPLILYSDSMCLHLVCLARYYVCSIFFSPDFFCLWQGIMYALFFVWQGIVYALFVDLFFLDKVLWVCMLYLISITSMACRLCLHGIMYAILRLIKALLSTTSCTPRTHTTHASLQAVSQVWKLSYSSKARLASRLQRCNGLKLLVYQALSYQCIRP